MREINNISDADLKAMESLDKNCLDLHLFPPPKTFIQMEVEGPDGKKVESRKMRSQSWNRNAYNQIMMTMGAVATNIAGTTFGGGQLNMKSTALSVLTSSSASTIAAAGNVGAVATATKGIVIGSSSAAESFDGGALAEQYEDGNVVRGTILPTPNENIPAGSTAGCVAVSADATYLAVGINTAPWIVMYKINNDKSLTRLGNITGLSSNPTSIAWSPDETYVAVANNNTFNVLKNNGDDTFSVLTPPSQPGEYARHVSFSPDGAYLAVSLQSAPGITIYKNNLNDTFTRLAALASISGTGNRNAWSSDGTYIAVAHSTAPYITVYKNLKNDSFTKMGALAAGSASGNSLCWSPDDLYIAMVGSSGTVIDLYKNAMNDTFSKISPLAGVVCNAGSVAFSSDGNYLLAVGVTSPFYKLFKNNRDDTFTAISNGSSVSNQASSTGAACCFMAGTYFAIVSTASPFFQIGKIQPTINYVAQNATNVNYSADNKKLTITLSRMFNNNSPEVAEINELGIYTTTSLGTVMMNRDVLAEPVEVPPAYKLTVTYTMEMTFPA